MKILVKFAVVAVVVLLCSNVSAQQNLKIAHINTETLMMSMPERDSAVKQLETLQKQLEQEMENLQVELRKKYDDYTQNSKNWTDLVRASREDEINMMNQKLQTFRQSAQEELQKKNADLMQPIITKIMKVVEEVAKEQNVTYVLESTEGGSILYKSLDALDLLPLVQTKMGIKK